MCEASGINGCLDTLQRVLSSHNRTRENGEIKLVGQGDTRRLDIPADTIFIDAGHPGNKDSDYFKVLLNTIIYYRRLGLGHRVCCLIDCRDLLAVFNEPLDEDLQTYLKAACLALKIPGNSHVYDVLSPTSTSQAMANFPNLSSWSHAQDLINQINKAEENKQRWCQATTTVQSLQRFKLPQAIFDLLETRAKEACNWQADLNAKDWRKRLLNWDQSNLSHIKNNTDLLELVNQLNDKDLNSHSFFSCPTPMTAHSRAWHHAMKLAQAQALTNAKHQGTNASEAEQTATHQIVSHKKARFAYSHVEKRQQQAHTYFGTTCTF